MNALDLDGFAPWGYVDFSKRKVPSKKKARTIKLDRKTERDKMNAEDALRVTSQDGKSP